MGRGLEGKESFAQRSRSGASSLKSKEVAEKRDNEQPQRRTKTKKEFVGERKGKEASSLPSTPRPSELLQTRGVTPATKVQATTLFSLSRKQGSAQGPVSLFDRAAQFIEKLGDPDEGRFKKAARATAVVLGVSSVSLGVGALSLGASGFFGAAVAAGAALGIVTAASLGAALYFRKRRRP